MEMSLMSKNSPFDPLVYYATQKEAPFQRYKIEVSFGQCF